MARSVAGPNGVLMDSGKGMPWLEAPQVAIGAIDFAVYVTQIGVGGVRLVAEAKRDRQTEDFWSTDPLFDDQGRAVLPFWTHTLTLTRSER